MTALATPSRMVRASLLLAVVLAAIVVPFLLFGSRIEAATLQWSTRAGPGVLSLGIAALLTLDVLLPVPSSVVSLITGQALGPTVGAAVIWSGMTLGCLVGTLVGRGVFGPLARIFRLDVPVGSTPPAVSDRWGWVPLVLLRPVPVLAEASILLAGARGAPIGQVMAVTSFANVPIAVLYGYFGAGLLGEVPLPVTIAALAILSAPSVWRQMVRHPRQSYP